jgi:hypothetical protein
MIALFGALVPMSVSAIAADDGRKGEAFMSTPHLFEFDITAQPLASALEAYSGVTGIETLYDSAVARSVQSATVRGQFTAVDALRMLLKETSLSARSIAQDAVTVEPERNQAQLGVDPTPDKSDHRLYYSLIQAGLERAFCDDSELQPGRYRAVLRFSIGADGRVRQPNLVGTTGSQDRDRLIVRALEHVSLGSSPPADLQQPIVVVVLPGSSGTALDCLSAR